MSSNVTTSLTMTLTQGTPANVILLLIAVSRGNIQQTDNKVVCCVSDTRECEIMMTDTEEKKEEKRRERNE